MYIQEPFQFDTRHWLLALLLAIAVHTTIFLSYQPRDNSVTTQVNQKNIIVQLKKITRPPKVTLPPVSKPQVEPLPEVVPETKPEPKPKPKIPKPVKKLVPVPKPEPKPIVDPPPEIVEVAPKQTQIKPPETKNLPQPEVAAPRVDPSLKKNYETKLLVWLERHKKYPNIARRRGQQGTVVVEFVINAKGELQSHRIVQASKHKALNEAVVKMLKRASPMPDVPKPLHGNETEFSYTIPIVFALKK